MRLVVAGYNKLNQKLSQSTDPVLFFKEYAAVRMRHLQLLDQWGLQILCRARSWRGSFNSTSMRRSTLALPADWSLDTVYQADTLHQQLFNKLIQDECFNKVVAPVFMSQVGSHIQVRYSTSINTAFTVNHPYPRSFKIYCILICLMCPHAHSVFQDLKNINLMSDEEHPGFTYIVSVKSDASLGVHVSPYISCRQNGFVVADTISVYRANRRKRDPDSPFSTHIIFTIESNELVTFHELLHLQHFLSAVPDRYNTVSKPPGMWTPEARYLYDTATMHGEWVRDWRGVHDVEELATIAGAPSSPTAAKAPANLRLPLHSENTLRMSLGLHWRSAHSALHVFKIKQFKKLISAEEFEAIYKLLSNHEVG